MNSEPLITKNRTPHAKPHYYISIDVEADGPCPGVNSMLQFGAVFYDCNGRELMHMDYNVTPLPDATQHPETMKWWAEQEEKNPGIWTSMTTNQIHPVTLVNAIELAVNKTLKSYGRPVVVAYPAGFDFAYLYYYLCRFSKSGESCVGFSALDMKTLGMAIQNTAYAESAKRNYPRKWFDPKLRHTHNAFEDAREQGYTFFQMLQALDELHSFVTC